MTKTVESEFRSWRAWPAGLLLVMMLGGLVMAPEPYNLVEPAAAQIPANCEDEGLCEGRASVVAGVEGVSVRCFHSFWSNVFNAGSCTAPFNDADEWEMEAGECGRLRSFQAEGVTAPGQPTTWETSIRHDDTNTVIITYDLDESDSGFQDRTFCATSDGTATGAPQSGTYRIRVFAERTTLGTYSVNSDDGGDNGFAWSTGALRSRLNVTAYSAPTPPAGSTFAYGTAGDEDVALSYTFTTINGDAGVETMRTFVRRTSDDALIENGATTDADGNSFQQSLTIDTTFDQALETYDACLELTGLSVLTGIRWTELSASGHDADLTRISDDVICDDDAFDADPRIVFSSDGAARDGGANANHDVYNRGESGTLDFWLLNARDEQLTRSMDFMFHDASETECLASTFTTTGAQYTGIETISTSLCTAVNTETGSPWHVHASNTDQAQDSLVALNVSTLYHVDSHPQLSVALSKDDFPTEDANEDFGYLIGSDTARNWCHVEGVRLDDTEIDTGVGDVTVTLFEPDGTQSAQTTRETGADGWTTSSFDVGAVAPAGVWQFQCDVSFNGNTGTDSEGINFVAQFTENLRLRVIAETAVFNGGNIIPIYVHVEEDDQDSLPEIVPRITISRVNEDTTPVTWEDQTPETVMLNVVTYEETINGALYVYNWSVPSVTDEYNIRVRAQVNDSGVREMHNIEVIDETDPDQVVIQENMLAVASFTGYSESESSIILLFLAMLLFSFFQRWLFVAIASVIGILEVMLNDPFGANGFAFTLLLLVIGIMLQILVDMRDAHADESDEAGT